MSSPEEDAEAKFGVQNIESPEKGMALRWGSSLRLSKLSKNEQLNESRSWAAA
jgi:hypothetical protein